MKRTVTTEQYFTPENTVLRCLELLEKYYPLGEFSLIVEPSAGAGAFLGKLPNDTAVGIDLHPLQPKITTADFLAWTPPQVKGRVLTIGNPPFGHRGALAVKFLDKACGYSDVVAFILPRSFRKYTFQNRINQFFHLVDAFNCQEFLTTQNQSVIVPSVFQIWQRQLDQRQRIDSPTSHPDFELTHAHLSRTTPQRLAELRNNYHFTIPQVGADFTPRNPYEVSQGSHWFIKANHNQVREIFDRLDFSFLDGMNTAHKSLSKRDIIAAYTQAKANS